MMMGSLEDMIVESQTKPADLPEVRTVLQYLSTVQYFLFVGTCQYVWNVCKIIVESLVPDGTELPGTGTFLYRKNYL